MKTKKQVHDAVFDLIARYGTDYAAGWEIGYTKGRQHLYKNYGKLWDREPPNHFKPHGFRWTRWTDGYKDGLYDRARDQRKIVSWHHCDHGWQSKFMAGNPKAIVSRLLRTKKIDSMRIGDISVSDMDGNVLYECG